MRRRWGSTAETNPLSLRAGVAERSNLGHTDVQQAYGIQPKDRRPLLRAQPARALDKADRIDFAHVRRIVSPHQYMVCTILPHEIFQLRMRIDQCVEVKPL